MQAVLYDQDPIDLQATYRTQGNLFMEEAAKGTGDKKDLLYKAIRLYNQALTV